MNRLLDASLDLLMEASPYLLLGFALSGLLHVLVERRPGLLDPIRGRGPRAVTLATLIGLPLPLCSCSVLPAALALRRKGASPGATSAFLITVPETDFVSVALTFGMMGPLMALLRPLASLLTGIAVGLGMDAAGRDRDAPLPAVPEPATCGCEDGCAADAPAERAWPLRAWRFGFAEFFDDLLPSLLAGLLLGAAITAWLPALDPALLAERPWLVYLLMCLIGVPMYVCASASTPIAAGLIAGGVSPGAALVFLLVGPATNAAGMLVLRREFGRGLFAIYLGGIVLVSLVLGVGLDALLTATGWSVAALIGTADGHEPGLLQRLSAAAFVLLSILSLNRSRPWRRWFGAAH